MAGIIPEAPSRHLHVHRGMVEVVVAVGWRQTCGSRSVPLAISYACFTCPRTDHAIHLHSSILRAGLVVIPKSFDGR